MFEVFEVGVILRDNTMEKAEHVALNIRIRVLVYRQPACRVLRKQYADPIASVAFRNKTRGLAGYIDHLFAARRSDLDALHF